MNIYNPYSCELYHYGIKGQKWGVRRYQYPDPDRRWTPEGKERYYKYVSSKTGRINNKEYNPKGDYITENKARKAKGEESSSSSGLTDKQKKAIKIAAGVTAVALATAGIIYATKKGYIKAGKKPTDEAIEMLSLDSSKDAAYLLKNTKKGRKIISDIWDDEVLDRGTTVTNLGTNEKGPQFDRFYGTVNKKDTDFYRQTFVETNNKRYRQRINQQIQDLKSKGFSDSSPEIIKLRQELISNGGKQTQYTTTYGLNNRAKIAGYNTGSREFSKWWRDTNQNTRDEIIERAKYAIDTNKNSQKSMTSIYNRFTKAVEDYRRGKIDDATFDRILRKDGYKLYNNTITYEYTNPTGKQWGGSDEYFERLRSKGYSGLKDFNDQALSSYKSENPIIFYKGRDEVNGILVGSSNATLERREIRKVNQSDKKWYNKSTIYVPGWGYVTPNVAYQRIKTEPDRMLKKKMGFGK